MTYRPRGASYPRAELVEGTDDLVLEDDSPDGGAFLRSSKHASGRRIDPASGPKVIRRFAKKTTLLDYEEQFAPTVSERFRQLIESLEPGVHQFEPVRYIGRDREFLDDRWLFQCCNRLESVNREHSRLNFDGFVWGPPYNERGVIVFDAKATENVSFWFDKHISIGLLVSDRAKDQMKKIKISGVQFRHYPQM